ncbi:hypothetical protein ACFE04_013550 [Oxalis oulophora]
MHAQLMPNDKIIIFDRTDAGPSNITLPTCTHSDKPCFAHSVEFDPTTKNVRPLTVLTETWCSSGALSPDGVLVQSGGNKLGARVVRFVSHCTDCDWKEQQAGLVEQRWYASNQILPNGKFIIVGGKRNFNYEFIPKTKDSDKNVYYLPFLKETFYSGKTYSPNNLYPFTHLSPDGNLFIFANDRAILLDYENNRVVKTYPVMPGNESHSYPSTGSSVLLPLKLSADSTIMPEAEVLVCGGTVPYSNDKANKSIFLKASKSCGRILVTSANPVWKMEIMPLNRLMGDMIMLPTGDVLIVNGAARGSAGWWTGREPVLNPVLYRPDTKTYRFDVLKASKIPRLYHSTANLLSDGRVMVGGSNPNRVYNFTAMYPTELSLEAFSPPYLSTKKHRPNITSMQPKLELPYNKKFSVNFHLKLIGEKKIGNLSMTMVAPSFTTHSFAMNQRLLVLAVDGVRRSAKESYVVVGYAPPNKAVAPPGYYMLFVVHDGVPSKAKWVHMK